VRQRTPHGLLYSIGNFGTSLSSFAVSTYMGYFYIALVGLPPRWVGWGLFAFSWWNAFNDPVAGWLSDRTRTRWGRRVPYIAVLTLPLAVSFAAVWAPPLATGRPASLFIYMLLAVTINDLLYTLVAINLAALFPEMFATLASRARVNGWRQIMSLGGMIVGVVLAPLIAERYGWPVMGAILGGVLAAALLLSLRGSREHRAYAQLRESRLRWSVGSALRHRAFLIVLGIGFLIRLALTTVNATMPFYASYVLGTGTRGAAWLLGATLLVALLAMQVWAGLLARWGVRRTLLVAQLAVGVAVLPLLVAQTLLAALATAALAGFSLAGLLITPEVLLAEVIDADHVRTGQRHEGMYFGLSNFANRLPNVLQAVGVGEMLTLVGFDATLAVQPPEVILGLRVLIGGVPLVALTLAALLTWVYPLHGARLAEVRERVTVLRGAIEGDERGANS